MFSSYNDYMPSMYKYNSSYLNKNYLNKAKTPIMPIPTSLLMNSDLNEEKYHNKVKRYDNNIYNILLLLRINKYINFPILNNQFYNYEKDSFCSLF